MAKKAKNQEMAPIIPVMNDAVEEKRDWSPKWDFPVQTEKLKTSAGIETPVVAVINSDTGMYVGQYRGEKMLPNKELIEKIGNSLTEKNIPFKLDARVTRDGARLFAKFELQYGFDGPDGTAHRMVIDVQNSYDGSLERGYAASILRLICLNGARAMTKIMSEFHRHQLNNQFSFSAEQIENALNEEKTAYGRLAQIPLTMEEGKNIVANIQRSAPLVLSERNSLVIQNNWLSPTVDENPMGNNLFRLMNSGTRFVRDTAGHKTELAYRLGNMWGERVQLAARNEKILTGLKSARMDNFHILANN